MTSNVQRLNSQTEHGSQMVIVSKSGSNNWHGDLFEYLRNSKLDARNFFDYGYLTPGYPTDCLNFSGTILAVPLVALSRRTRHFSTSFMKASERAPGQQSLTLSSSPTRPPPP